MAKRRATLPESGPQDHDCEALKGSEHRVLQAATGSTILF